MQRRFRQVDVFTTVPYFGNPVAVVLDGDGLSYEQMQRIARWTNLSETTFVCKPDSAEADYRLRIFTPASELPFAGHPTIGSAHALLEAGLRPRQAGLLVQECGVGLVRLRSGDPGIRICLPAARLTQVDAAACAELEQALGIALPGAPVMVDMGVKWLTAQAASGAALRAARPDMDKLLRLTLRLRAGANIFGLDGDTVEVRSFAPNEGVPEDPVCGSGNGAVAYYLRKQRGPVDYAARQGRCVGRDGHIAVAYGADGTIWLGGRAVSCIEGVISA